MALRITTQKVDTWKKRIQRDGLSGSTYFCQQGGNVWVSASMDHQKICKSILGKPNGKSSLESYLRWDNVLSTDLVELLYKIETSQ